MSRTPNMVERPLAVLILLATASLASASEPESTACVALAGMSPLAFDLDPSAPAPSPLLLDDGAEPGDDAETVVAWLPTPKAFGSRGTRRIQFMGGYAFAFTESSNQLAIIGVGVSHFVAHGLSFDVDLNILDIDQDGSDTWGINLDLLFRWHFVRNPGWSLYFDGGAGMMYSNDQVPDSGSDFNFTPQLGVGATIEVAKDVRLMTGVRWFHISNANLFEDNPGRDSLLVYMGLSLPF